MEWKRKWKWKWLLFCYLIYCAPSDFAESKIASHFNQKQLINNSCAIIWLLWARAIKKDFQQFHHLQNAHILVRMQMHLDVVIWPMTMTTTTTKKKWFYLKFKPNAKNRIEINLIVPMRRKFKDCMWLDSRFCTGVLLLLLFCTIDGRWISARSLKHGTFIILTPLNPHVNVNSWLFFFALFIPQLHFAFLISGLFFFRFRGNYHQLFMFFSFCSPFIIYSVCVCVCARGLLHF